MRCDSSQSEQIPDFNGLLIHSITRYASIDMRPSTNSGRAAA
ncbi:MAG: hypothetical protein ACTHK7_24575 [Aureliella sp.]